MAKIVALVWDENKAYFFKGSQNVRYDIAADRADDGYPQAISSAWAGVFESDLDAAVVWPNGKAYFFKGDQYTRYDIAADRADEGYPQAISSGWTGVFESDLDAAVVWPNSKAYFFKGDQYIRYDIAADRADDGYPQAISSGWAGVFESNLDTAVVWPNSKAYFFQGDQYIRYDIAADQADEGYPQAITSGWNLSAAAASGGTSTQPAADGAAAANGETQASVRNVFLQFSQPLEGRVYWMYLDIKGLVTTGVGNLIDPVALATKLPFVHKGDGSPASEAEITEEWQRLKDDQSLAQKGHRACEAITDLRLTDAAIDELVLAKFDGDDRVLRRAFSNWGLWPADAQLGAHSIAWAGAGFPAKWPKFRAAAEVRDWQTVAAASHIDETGNPGVKARNEANAKLFHNAQVVENGDLDRTAVHYPQML
jgi:hypothetical protein